MADRIKRLSGDGRVRVREDYLTDLGDRSFRVKRGEFYNHRTIWIGKEQYLVDPLLANFSNNVSNKQEVYKVLREEGYNDGEEAVVRPVHDREIANEVILKYHEIMEEVIREILREGLESFVD